MTSVKFKDAVGFSKLDVFRECPAKFKYQFIDKIKETRQSDALVRGSRIHDECEAYVRGWVKELPTELEKWQEAMDMLRDAKATPESAWGFNRNWELLPDWFHPDTWLRAKSDCHYLSIPTKLVIIDFKTGKYRVPSTEQIELYAICGHAVYPQVEEVIAEFWFLDTDQTYTKTYTAEHLMLLRKKYEDYFAPIFTEEQWKPVPSRDCKWCSYSKAKGGQCEY
jgi:hypothetical protein